MGARVASGQPISICWNRPLLEYEKKPNECFESGYLIKGLSDGETEQKITRIFHAIHEKPLWIEEIFQKLPSVELHSHKEGEGTFEEIFELLKAEQNYLRESKKLIYFDVTRYTFNEGWFKFEIDKGDYEQIREKILDTHKKKLKIREDLEIFLGENFFQNNPKLLKQIDTKESINRFLSTFKYDYASDGSDEEKESNSAEDEMEASAGKSPPKHPTTPRLVGKDECRASKEVKAPKLLLYEILTTICYIPVNCLGGQLFQKIKAEVSPSTEGNDSENYERFFNSFGLRGAMIDRIRPWVFFLFLMKKAIISGLVYKELMTELSLVEIPTKFLSVFHDLTIDADTQGLKLEKLNKENLNRLYEELAQSGFLEIYSKESQEILNKFQIAALEYKREVFIQIFSEEFLRKEDVTQLLRNLSLEIQEEDKENLSTLLGKLFEKLNESSNTLFFDQDMIFESIRDWLSETYVKKNKEDVLFTISWELNRDKLKRIFERKFKKFSKIFNFQMRFNLEVMRVGKRSIKADNKDLARFFAKLAAAHFLIEKDSRVTGVTITGPEEEYRATTDSEGQLLITQFLRQKFRASEGNNSAHYTVHALEKSKMTDTNTNTKILRGIIDKIAPERISHLTRILNCTKLDTIFNEFYKKNICAEFCSGTIKYTVGKDAHPPYKEFLNRHLPFVLCSDDQGIGNFGLWNEYLAVFNGLKEDYELTKNCGTKQKALGGDHYLRVYEIFKQSVLQGIHYSFLPGESLFQEKFVTIDGKPRRIYCLHEVFKDSKGENFILSEKMKNFLKASTKAIAMVDMILRLKEFEKFVLEEFPKTLNSDQKEYIRTYSLK